MTIRPRLDSLRMVLAALVLLGVVPLVGLTIHSTLRQRAEAHDHVALDARRLARIAALHQADLLEGGEQLLDGITRDPGITVADPAECAERMRNLLAVHPRFTNLGVVGLDGEVRCSAVPLPTPGVNLADRAWFQRALATRDFSVGDYQIGRISGRPSLGFGAPIFSPGGEIRAVAYSALALEWLQDLVETVPHDGPRPALSVLDRRGTILARYPSPKDWIGRPLPDRPRTVILSQGEGTTEIVGEDGVRRLYAFTPLGDAEDPFGFLSVAVPTSKAYRGADTELVGNLLALSVIVVAGGAAARGIAARRVVQPAEALLAAARRLGAGDLDARIGPPYRRGELGQVSRGFDEMAGALADRETALRRALDERDRIGEQLRAIVDNAPAVISMRDLEGRYLLVNQEFERTRGISRDAARGRTATELFGTVVGGEITAHDRRAIEGDGADEWTQLLATDGETATYLTLTFPLRDATGAAYGVCSIARDITERLHSEAEQAALEERLVQSERLESLGQLAGGVAHDFNNLLAVILNYTDFVVGSLPDDPPEDLAALFEAMRGDLANVLRAASSAADLTRQLLIFSRRDTPDPQVIDVNSVVTTVEPLLTRTLGEGIAVELSLAPGIHPVRADAGRLQQVVVNLAVNARDAMPRGGTLRVVTANVDLDEAAASRLDMTPGPAIRLTVADTGSGMAPEVTARAFEPFFTTKPKGRGTGLGLATVFGIVTEAGGQVAIESEPARGTAIIVHLPAAVGRDRDEGAAEDGDPEAGRGETVLIVEDEAPVREVARRILTGCGYQVLTAGDAMEALDVCDDDAVSLDLVLTDVVMPGLSGPDLLSLVRTRRPGTAGMLISGYPDSVVLPDDTEDVEVLEKPFTSRTLLTAVRRVLDGEAPAVT